MRTEEGSAVQHPFLKLFEVEINYRSDVKRYELRNDQAADDDQPEGPSRGAVSPVAERDWDCAEDGGERGHQDRAEAIHAGVVNRLLRGFARFHTLACEVDDHDSVLLD